MPLGFTLQALERSRAWLFEIADRLLQVAVDCICQSLRYARCAGVVFPAADDCLHRVDPFVDLSVGDSVIFDQRVNVPGAYAAAFAVEGEPVAFGVVFRHGHGSHR